MIPISRARRHMSSLRPQRFRTMNKEPLGHDGEVQRRARVLSGAHSADENLRL